jgi:hypothetical protein
MICRSYSGSKTTPEDYMAITWIPDAVYEKPFEDFQCYRS